ncbi:MAG: hypothetical protein OXE97_01815, partial [Gammaproteobacteria bacterium]|nr:hypothetical protein [Gammaproteobacteria bacterium]
MTKLTGSGNPAALPAALTNQSAAAAIKAQQEAGSRGRNDKTKGNDTGAAKLLVTSKNALRGIFRDGNEKV